MKNFILLSKKALIICLLLCVSNVLTTQTKHTVNNNAGAATDFTDLQAAIDAAVVGDTIYVQHSPTTYGNIILNKGLTLVGRSNSDNGYISSVGTISIANGASNSTIQGFNISQVNESSTNQTLSNISFFDNEFTGSFFVGFSHNVDNVLIQGNVFRGQFNIYTQSSNVLISNNIFLSSSLNFYTADTLLFSNNVIAYQSTGVDIYNRSSSSLLNISDCIFVINSATDRQIDLIPGSATIQVDNCVSYNYNSGSNYNFETGTSITINANVQSNINPLFTNIDATVAASIAGTSTDFDPLIDDLTLQAGSTVADDGLYEGYMFKSFGTPTGYPSIKVKSYSPTVAKNGNLSVTIEAKTN